MTAEKMWRNIAIAALTLPMICIVLLPRAIGGLIWVFEHLAR